MALKEYRKKRSTDKTPEPFGGKSDKDKLIFVVQKHHATNLHYDFRLEMCGVLKSWAVPKGPSINPEVKRLAMMVEDHPYDYKDFEGIIPKGQYGGGTVIVWDQGTYEAADVKKGASKKEQEKALMHQLQSGKLKISLHGKKLKGEYALVKVKGRGENGWLLMKLEDKHASTDDITKKDKSVVSKKSLEQVAKTSKNVWNSKRAEPQQKLGEKLQVSEEKPQEGGADVSALLKKGKRAKMPSGIQPMLATLVKEPFEEEGWYYEVKWDGYRCLAFIDKGKSELFSRNNKSFNKKFYPLKEILDQWSFKAVIDGEIAVIDEGGISNFEALQNWRSEADGELMMYVFDILWYEGKDLTGLPLSERHAILKEILPTADDRIRLSQVFETDGWEFYDAARKLGLEGIMAKKADSAYATGTRSKQWLKVKIGKRQEVVIGGYTKNAGTSRKFSSLLLGVYENGSFRYVGKVGTGFSAQMQKDLMKTVKPLVISKSPFDVEPDVNKPSRFRPKPPKAEATWLKPELVCEVSFTQVTADGVFRHPSFEGLREDKSAQEVVREVAADTEDIVKEAKQEPAAGPKLVKPATGKNRKTLLNPNEKTQVKKVNRHELKFTNLDKFYWPEEKITKRDMLNYYYQVADYILPYLKDRPLSLNRFPNGIKGKSFYQKDVKGKSPDWVKTHPYTSEGEDKEFLVGDDKATLLWMASLGCIEMNPWFSRVQTPDNPDYCVLDLDPDKKTTFDQVIRAALEVKQVLDEMDVPSFPKTSGSTGIHIYIPLGAKYDYDQSQLFARLVVNEVQARIPEFTSVERMIKKRKGKMYLDFLQNRPGATLACPYSLRPKPGATVSMPLHWDEVKKGLAISDFTIHNTLDRLKSEGDLFKGVLGKGIDMEKALSQLT